MKVAKRVAARRGRPPQTERRPQIIKAAREVLAARGYAETSLRQIAEHAGIAPGLLTYYYPSKQELLFAVVEDLDRELTGGWREAMQGIDQPLPRILAGLDHVIATWSAQPEMFRLLVDLAMLGTTNEAVRERTRALLEHPISEITEEIERISQDLPIPPPVGIDLARAIMAGFHGALMHAMCLENDPAQTFAALRLMVMSTAAMSYVAAGEPIPEAMLGLVDFGTD